MELPYGCIICPACQGKYKGVSISKKRCAICLNSGLWNELVEMQVLEYCKNQGAFFGGNEALLLKNLHAKYFNRE